MLLKDVPDVLTRLFHVGQTVELRGGPGIGKSEVVRQVRDRLEKEIGEPVGLATTILSQRDSVDVGGFMIPQKEKYTRPDGSEFEVVASRFSTPPIFPMPHQWPGGEVPKYGIIFLDERAQASHDVQKTCAQLMLDGRVGDFDLKNYGHWVVWSASNRMSDKSGTVRDLAFLTNRILFLDIHPHVGSWEDWAMRNKVNPLFIAYAHQHPQNIFRDHVPDQEGPFATPRTLVMASKIAEDDCMGLGHPHLTEVLSGLLGEGVGAELMAFSRVKEVVPTFDEVIRSPKTAKLPPEDRPDAQYYAVQMCIHHVDVKTSNDVLTYLFRLPVEFQVAAVQGAMRAAPKAFTRNKTFSEWVRKNEQLISQTLNN